MTQINTKYETETGEIHPIRVSQETYNAISADIPTGNITSRISVKISRAKNEYGIRPRLARLYRIIGTAPNTARLFTFLPVLNPDAETLAKYDVDSSVTVGGVIYTSAGILNENIR